MTTQVARSRQQFSWNKWLGNLSLVMMLILILMINAPLSLAKSSCHDPGFRCLKVKKNQSWRSLFPNERERAIVKRINHTNGYTYPGQLIKVPEDLTYSDLLDFSPFPLYVESPNEKIIVFDPGKYAWAAYDSDGQLVRWGPATGGGKWCKDIQKSCKTRAGEFRVYSLGSSNCASRKYPLPDGGAPMPYCMFFNGGEAFHGSPGGVKKANVSHGCIRLFIEDAEWMRYDFVEKPYAGNDYQGTKVVVLPYPDDEELAS